LAPAEPRKVEPVPVTLLQSCQSAQTKDSDEAPPAWTDQLTIGTVSPP
jgi:hypothetical protein